MQRYVITFTDMVTGEVRSETVKWRSLTVGDEDVFDGDHRTMTVQDDDAPQDTGLVDEHGTPIRRVRNPVGFKR